MLNIHRAGHSHPLVAARPTTGAVDICFRWNAPIDAAVETLAAAGVEIIEGPVARICSDAIEGRSVYFRDPDGNLIELLSTVAG
jgi:catechol 2,3-dioxygenase-like lactoylglutathione lyase family enzyme